MRYVAILVQPMIFNRAWGNEFQNLSYTLYLRYISDICGRIKDFLQINTFLLSLP